MREHVLYELSLQKRFAHAVVYIRRRYVRKPLAQRLVRFFHLTVCVIHNPTHKQTGKAFVIAQQFGYGAAAFYPNHFVGVYKADPSAFPLVTVQAIVIRVALGELMRSTEIPYCDFVL